MNPALLIVAGPNGAGKTTITVRLHSDHWSDGVEYLNPDDIAQQRFGDWNSNEAVLEAALRKVHCPLPEWIATQIDDLPRHAAFEDLRA